MGVPCGFWEARTARQAPPRRHLYLGAGRTRPRWPRPSAATIDRQPRRLAGQSPSPPRPPSKSVSQEHQVPQTFLTLAHVGRRDSVSDRLTEVAGALGGEVLQRLGRECVVNCLADARGRSGLAGGARGHGLAVAAEPRVTRVCRHAVHADPLCLVGDAAAAPRVFARCRARGPRLAGRGRPRLSGSPRLA